MKRNMYFLKFGRKFSSNSQLLWVFDVFPLIILLFSFLPNNAIGIPNSFNSNYMLSTRVVKGKELINGSIIKSFISNEYIKKIAGEELTGEELIEKKKDYTDMILWYAIDEISRRNNKSIAEPIAYWLRRNSAYKSKDTIRMLTKIANGGDFSKYELKKYVEEFIRYLNDNHEIRRRFYSNYRFDLSCDEIVSQIIDLLQRNMISSRTPNRTWGDLNRFFQLLWAQVQLKVSQIATP